MKPKIGEIIYDSGDCWSAISPIMVDKENISIITEFWNRLFFRTADEAQYKNNVMHSRYGEYQASTWNG